MQSSLNYIRQQQLEGLSITKEAVSTFTAGSLSLREKEVGEEEENEVVIEKEEEGGGGGREGGGGGGGEKKMKRK